MIIEINFDLSERLPKFNFNTDKSLAYLFHSVHSTVNKLVESKGLTENVITINFCCNASGKLFHYLFGIIISLIMFLRTC